MSTRTIRVAALDHGGYAVTSAVSQLSLRGSASTVSSPPSSRMRTARVSGQATHPRREHGHARQACGRDGLCACWRAKACCTVSPDSVITWRAANAEITPSGPFAAEPASWAWTGPPKRPARTGGITERSAIRAWNVIRHADGAERAVRSAPSAVCRPIRSGLPGALAPECRRRPGAS